MIKSKVTLFTLLKIITILFGIGGLLSVIFLGILFVKEYKEEIMIIPIIHASICIMICFFLTAVILPRMQRKNKKFNQAYSKNLNAMDINEIEIWEFEKSKGLLTQYLQEENRYEKIKIASKQAEYYSLQNQINPHFLYNTLDAVRGDALVAGLPDLAGTLEALSDFFRYTISNTEFLVTVEDELDNITNYFRIQRYRFGTELTLEIKFHGDEKEIRNLQMPKLTLQPVVENSVFHGLEAKRNKGNISIIFEDTSDVLFISIRDNGVGMNAKTLEELNLDISSRSDSEDLQKKVSGNGIALRNIVNRIKLLYGDEYGVTIYSTKNVGTNVCISIPRRTLLN